MGAWQQQAGGPRIPVRLLKGVSICELAESGYYSESELCEVFPVGVVHAALMRARGDTATDYKRASLSLQDCLAAGFKISEMYAGGYRLSEMALFRIKESFSNY
jgi:hypothetical protein